MSVRLDRLQRGLYEALSGVAGSVLWTMSEVPHEQLDDVDILTLESTAGPTHVHRRHSQGTLLAPADSIIVRVDAATVGTRNIVRLNEFDYYYDAIGGDTATDIRDDLLPQIQAGEVGSVTATADGADGIALAGDFLGGLRSLTLLGELSSESEVFSGDAVLVTESTVTFLITLDAYSKNREPRNGAMSVIDAAIDQLHSLDVVENLGRYGLGLWDIIGTTDLSGIAGAHWETRAAANVTVAARTVFVRPVDQIETTTAAVVVEGVGTVTATATAP